MKKVIWGLCIALGLMALAGIILVESLKPDYSFSIESRHVEAPVEVVFDDMAVPHIYAESEADGMFALGYVHASERLWQMDLLRRAGAGELAELLGEDMVENDRYLRTLGMREAALRSAVNFEEGAPEAIQNAMRAYLKGVNEFIDKGQAPLEYLLLGADPRPFTIRDVFCSTGFMAYSFAIHLKTEPILDWMKHTLDEAYWVDLAVGPEGFTRIPSDSSDWHDLSGLSARVSGLDAVRPVPQWLGSNAWVISGDRTASGEVLFCNDAHMAFASPSVWYEAHLQAGSLNYYGNHLAGLPFPAIGHTREHAWGITMFVNDDIDLYRETIENESYLRDGEWFPLEVRREVIHVAGADSVEFWVRSTPHGPLIEEDVAMWWTFTQYPENRLHEAFYGFSRYEGIEAFERCAALVHAPGLNLMYGDAEGNIGWWASAKLPMRPEDVDTKTTIDGSNARHDPTGWYPFSANPHSVNPSSGFVYSANNAPGLSQGIHHPGHYYSGNTRAAGILEALSSPKSDWTSEDAQGLQLDHHSLVYRENAAAMMRYVSEMELPEAALGLVGWDGAHREEDIAPTIYYRWMYRTIQGAMADEFEAHSEEDAAEKFETWHKTIVSENTFPRLLANPDSPWWDDLSTPLIERPEDIVSKALVAAIDDLTQALGPDHRAWHYNRLHTVTHHHAMTGVPIIGRWLDVGPFPVPAAKDALNKYEFKLKDEVDYAVFSGPSMRISVDFSSVDSSMSILPTGQSGNALSPFYKNQAPLYHTGQFRWQRMDQEDILNHASGHSMIWPVP